MQEVTGNADTDWERQIAERNARIATLEGQVAEAAKNTKTAESLRSEIAELKAQDESYRIDFKPQLAGVRSVKAARAILADHDNKLKEAEPWLFEGDGKRTANAASTTGLPNAGAATDIDKRLKLWREVAGPADDSEKKG